MKDLEKTMADEMNEVWMDSIAQNIEFLIPKAWLPQINEMLPKLLNIVKISLMKSIKKVSQSLGDNIFMIMNVPVISDGKTYNVPHYIMINKNQIDFMQQPTAEFPNGDFKLKAGELPKAFYSFAKFAEKIKSYTDVKDLIADINSGKLMEFTIPGTEQKKIS